MAERQDLDDLFARARGADIVAVAGVTLRRQGRRLRGPCPICVSGKSKAPAAVPSGPAKKAKRKGPSTAFSVDPGSRIWFCFGSCNDGGDVIELERRLRGGTPREAAERLVGAVPAAAPRSAPSTASRSPSPPPPGAGEDPRQAGPSPAEKVARELWAGSVVIIGDVGAVPRRYWGGRGLSPAAIETATRRLLYHPRAKWGFDPERGDWIHAPAIVGLVVSPSGRTGGVHCTYLKADGSGKARLDPAKRMWGPQKDADGRPGGVWLTPPNAPGPLVVGEGIESTLAAMQLLGRPCRGVATLSLGALQGGWKTDAWGRIDPTCVAGDPERPAFTWPDQDEVLIAVDRDMSPIEVRVRKVGGGTVRRWLDAEDRARICAGLAVQAWKAAGANAVRAIAPGAGRDFNDELLARVGA